MKRTTPTVTQFIIVDETEAASSATAANARMDVGELRPSTADAIARAVQEGATSTLSVACPWFHRQKTIGTW